MPLSFLALKFEIRVLFRIPRYLRDSDNSFGLPILSKLFSLAEAFFFVAISFNASYFAFLNNSLSMWSLDFLNFWEGLSLELIFPKTSPSSLERLIVQGSFYKHHPYSFSMNASLLLANITCFKFRNFLCTKNKLMICQTYIKDSFLRNSWRESCQNMIN